MLSRRDFLKYTGSAAAAYSLSGVPLDSESNEIKSQYVDVNIPEFKLKFKGKVFDVSLGKPKTPTPIGNGIIYQKIERPVFRYRDPGPLQGQIVKYTEDINGKTVRVPYEKFRALAIRINAGSKWGNTERYRIHSTTEYWNMRQAISDGCIRVNIPDMLELYSIVPVNTQILFRYDTIKMDDSGFVVFPDIYRKKTNKLEALENRLKDAGIEKAEKEKLQNILSSHLGKHILFSDL